MATLKQIVDKVPARLNIVVMLFLSTFFLYLVRALFSINLLAMVQPTISDDNGTLIQLPDYGPRYAWSAYDQSLLLGAFFWGYTITPVLSGFFVEKYGHAKSIVGFSNGICTVLVALGPTMAASFPAILFQRFAIGIVSGAVMPAVFKIISKWSPPNERGKFLSCIFGAEFGTIGTWSLCGVLIERFGWMWAFYVPALLTAIFTALWYFLVFDTPAKHPRILPREKQYIEKSLDGLSEGLQSWPPLKSIITSIPFWTLLILVYGNVWGMFFLLTAAPKFMNQVLGFDLAASGFLASLPYVMKIFSGFVFGALQDYLKSKQWISQHVIRKGFCLICLFLVGILFVSSQPLLCVTFMALSYGFNGAVVLTAYPNFYDLSPNYATSMFSIINTVASTSGFVSPLVVAYFTQDGSTVDDWTMVFVVGALAYIVPAVLFMIFGSVEIQHWNEPARTELNQSLQLNEKEKAAQIQSNKYVY